MDKEKLVISLWVIILLYGVSSFLVGKTGLVALRDLSVEHERLCKNMEELRKINASLGGTVDSLRSDPDTISVYARELGLGKDGERFVRVVGLPPAQKRMFAAGRFLTPNPPAGVNDRSLRVFAMLGGLAMLAGLVFSNRPRHDP